MAVKPKIVTLTNSSVDVLNVIRNNATQNYRDYVPVATPDADSIRTIGAIIMDNPSLQNEFLNALINRIGLVLISSRMYENPWARFKRGKLEFGETIEEIFVNLIKAQTFDPSIAESQIYKREKPDVRSAFHIMNYQKFYKTTVSEDQLRQAFLSWNGIGDLVSKIIEAMITSANYDEFQVMKYMVGKKILEGRLYPVEIPAVSASNAKSIVTTIKGFSNDLEFLSSKYNIAGVYNRTEKSRQYLIVNSKFDALIDVEVLVSAFNMSKAEFMGHKILVDSFGTLDSARLDELFDGDDTYTEISAEQLAALDNVPAILVSDDWFMIYDNLETMRDLENGQGLYRQYWYHVWKTFSVSPFANGAMLIPATPSITSVAVTPSTATMSEGTIALKATVTTANFAPQSVVWSVKEADAEKATVTQTGVVTLADDLDDTTITIYATSTFDNTVAGSCVITVPDAD